MTNFTNQLEPTLDVFSSDPVTPAFIQTRNALKATGFYLGDHAKTFKNLVVWKRVGRGNILVTKESATAIDDAEKVQAAETNSGQTTSKRNNELFLEPAVLSTIVLIDYDDCWLVPCGYWKGPNTVTPNFEDLKLSFQGKAPSQSTLSHDFTETIGNTSWLIDNVALGGAPVKGFLGQSKDGSSALRFRHVVFEKIEDTSAGSETASDSDDDWTMTNWPVIYPEATAQCEKLASTHRPIPLPAYNIGGTLITPDQCKNALAGATARVSFTLNHWFIEKGSKDQPSNIFVANVNSIRVLVNPPCQATSPKKRKTARYDPGEGSSTKRVNRI